MIKMEQMFGLIDLVGMVYGSTRAQYVPPKCVVANLYFNNRIL